MEIKIKQLINDKFYEMFHWSAVFSKKKDFISAELNMYIPVVIFQIKNSARYFNSNTVAESSTQNLCQIFQTKTSARFSKSKKVPDISNQK